MDHPECTCPKSYHYCINTYRNMESSISIGITWSTSFEFFTPHRTNEGFMMLCDGWRALASSGGGRIIRPNPQSSLMPSLPQCLLPLTKTPRFGTLRFRSGTISKIFSTDWIRNEQKLNKHIMIIFWPKSKM